MHRKKKMWIYAVAIIAVIVLGYLLLTSGAKSGTNNQNSNSMNGNTNGNSNPSVSGQGQNPPATENPGTKQIWSLLTLKTGRVYMLITLIILLT